MKKSLFLIIALFILLYIIPLGVRPIIIPDESRYAEIPREMISSGDWVVPHLNGLRYFEKPVLGYWINAASMTLFGENGFGIRLPSAMAVGVSALMIFILVRRFAGGYPGGILTAAVFLTCMVVFGVGTFCVLDSVLSMFVTAVMVSFFFAYIEDRRLKKAVLLILVGVFCGLAFLTKGFIGFAIPAVAIFPFMLWERRWREFFRISWVPITAAVLVVLPWALMIHLREPDFWHYFFWNEHIRRFMSENAQHSESFWYFILLFPVAVLPWIFLLPAVVLGIKEIRFKRPIVRFAICWFVFPLLFFSASNGKLLTYILPCFPPFVILIAAGLLKYFEGGKKRAFVIGVRILCVLTVTLTVALVVSQMTDFLGLKFYGPSETWKWVAGAVGLTTWTVFLLLVKREADFRKKLVLYCIAPVLFMFSAHFIINDQSKERKAPGDFLMRHSHRVSQDTVLVSEDDPVRAVCWFYKRNDVFLFRGGGELDYGLRYDDSKCRLLTLNQFKELVAKGYGKNSVVLIAEAKRYVQYRSLLPKPLFEDIGGRFVFAQF